MPSAAISSFEAGPVDPLAEQRARGTARVSFGVRDGATVLKGLYQDGAAKALLPKGEGGVPHAVLVNTAGGLTGGDAMLYEVEVAAAGRAIVTTQACEKIYRSAHGAAHVEAVLRAGAGGRIDWLPQETILYDEARLARRFDVDLEDDARLFAMESVIFGRTAMGETVGVGSFRDRWRIRRNGALIFADDTRFEGGIADMLARPAILAGAAAMASMIYVGEDAERFVAPVRELAGDRGGASAFDGKLTIRLTAEDGKSLRRMLIPIAHAMLAGAALPRVWQS